jgi:hypothetical protein
MDDEELSHRDTIQAMAQLVLGRIGRDIDHVDAIFCAANLKQDAAVDAINTLTDLSRVLHELMHRLDDDMMGWVQREHVAATLVESQTE